MKPIFNKVPSEYYDQYQKYFDLKWYQHKHGDPKCGFRFQYARDHPVTFAYFCLGKTLRPYQAFAIDKILENPKTALNWGRRLGKSTVFSILALWMTYFNKYPKNEMENFTVVGIISKEADAAKKLLGFIRILIHEGDRHLAVMIGRKETTCIKDYFSRNLIEPNNSEQLTWHNNSCIKSFPPTKKVRGWGFSYEFIDEIAHLTPTDESPEDFYNLTCRPTLMECGGKESIASTPRGQSGLFYNLFDPTDKFGVDRVRLWFSWEIADGNTQEEITYRQQVMGEKDRLYKEGKEAYFRQEYMGDFTVIQHGFYDFDDVTNYFDNSLCAMYEWHKSPCSIGIDFGISDCLTVVTVKTKYLGKVITLYQRAFPRGFDNNELMNPNNDDSIPRLRKRYNLQWLVPEESSVSDMFVKWCKREGYPVFPCRFSGGNFGSKNTAYHTHRAMLKSGAIRSFPIPKLKEEMMGLQEKQEKVNWIISRPPGGYDDHIDSDVYATVPFFEDEGHGFGGTADYNDYLMKEKDKEGLKLDLTSTDVRKDKDRKNFGAAQNQYGHVSSPM